MFSPVLILRVLRQRAENIPSVQSFVATSRRPNICAAVIDFGFIRISLQEKNKVIRLMLGNTDSKVKFMCTCEEFPFQIRQP